MFLLSKNYRSTIKKWCKDNSVTYNKSRLDTYEQSLISSGYDDYEITNKVSLALANDLINKPSIGYYDFKLEDTGYGAYTLLKDCAKEFTSDSILYLGGRLLDPLDLEKEFCIVLDHDELIARVLFVKVDLDNLIENAKNKLSEIETLLTVGFKETVVNGECCKNPLNDWDRRLLKDDSYKTKSRLRVLLWFKELCCY